MDLASPELAGVGAIATAIGVTVAVVAFAINQLHAFVGRRRRNREYMDFLVGYNRADDAELIALVPSDEIQRYCALQLLRLAEVAEKLAKREEGSEDGAEL